MPLQSLATSMPRTSTALASSLRHACGLLFATALPMSRFFFEEAARAEKKKKSMCLDWTADAQQAFGWCS
jgi:hypothetical protein